MELLGWFTCMFKGHKRGVRYPEGDKSEDYGRIITHRAFRCPRCNGNERRYKVKPKSADVLQIPSAKREST